MKIYIINNQLDKCSNDINFRAIFVYGYYYLRENLTKHNMYELKNVIASKYKFILISITVCSVILRDIKMSYKIK